MTAYYNEIDPYAAQWLRNLIKAGHIADGVVDERSIEDIHPNELAEFTQCHFFAGVGVWSLALRRAGWPDDREIWTGSCPCQPFSAAGKGAGVADERHLWPAFFHLITQRKPSRIYGEQVASKDGLGWLDIVQTDLEGAGYSSGAVDLCAAGVGAPHIRQRLWFFAERLANPSDLRLNESGECITQTRSNGAAGNSPTGRLGNADSQHARRNTGTSAEEERGAVLRPVCDGSGSPSSIDGMANTKIIGRGEQCANFERSRKRSTQEELEQRSGSCGVLTSEGWPGPTNGLWRDADWLHCRDGKWRPVEPGTFPLANGAPQRVGRLRAYGNAINLEAAQAFIEATI